MTKVTTEQLELVANELNELLDGEVQNLKADEQIVPTTGEEEEILLKIHEAVDILAPTDKLTDDLCEIVESTSLGDAIFSSNREDIDEDISIRALFVTRTKIALDMGEPVPEPEKEPEPKKVKKPRKKKPVKEEPPVEEKPEEEPEEEPEPEPEPEPEEPPVEEESTEEVPVPDPVPETKNTLADLDVDALVQKLLKEGVQIRRKQTNWERGKSPYSIALELACQNPDTTLAHLRELFVAKTGMVLDKTTTPGIRTAHSLVTKVIGYLRDAGNMPKKSTRKAK